MQKIILFILIYILVLFTLIFISKMYKLFKLLITSQLIISINKKLLKYCKIVASNILDEFFDLEGEESSLLKIVKSNNKEDSFIIYLNIAFKEDINNFILVNTESDTIIDLKNPIEFKSLRVIIKRIILVKKFIRRINSKNKIIINKYY